MKSLHASSTGSLEGISIAVIQVWTETVFDVEAKVVQVADHAGVGIFQSLHDQDVGRSLLNQTSLFWDHFSSWLDNNPDLKSVFQKGKAQDESGFKMIIGVDLGAALKKSQWWKRNVKEILAAKRRHKIARDVMES